MVFEPDVIRRFERLYSSLVSDCAEAVGLGPRALAPGLQPYHADTLRVVVGPAHTAQIHKTSTRVEIDMLLSMVDATPPASVCVVATDEDVQGALWGGLMSAGVQQRGAVGAVVDGGVRDLHQISPLDFAVFATYRSPLDIRGRGEMVGFGETVVCRGVEIAPGDLVFADANGAVALPAGAALDVLRLCEERVTKEVATEHELRDGDSAVEVYKRHEAF
ncbi:MAG TPA: RraA family protein [Acidimicrobiales bacterium]|nr:RraA family protein [Acidimicrobiales bacterium]